MTRDYDGPGGTRTRRRGERCDRKPGARIVPGNQISQQDLAERIAWETAHDPEVRLTLDPEIMAGLVAEHAGRCHECGRVIGMVDVCKFCRAVQTAVWQRHVERRETRKVKG